MQEAWLGLLSIVLGLVNDALDNPVPIDSNIFITLFFICVAILLIRLEFPEKDKEYY